MGTEKVFEKETDAGETGKAVIRQGYSVTERKGC